MRNKTKFIFLSIIFLGLFGRAESLRAAWTPPIGIPDPYLSWGGIQNPIDDTSPSRPSLWTSEIAGYYYVDDAIGCSDARIFGYPGSARCSIPNPTPAGSYVELHGIYDQKTGGSVRFFGNGNSGTWVANTSGPVWIVGQSGDEPTVTGGLSIVYGSYVYLYNLRFSGNTTGNVLQVSSASAGFGAHHIAIRNNNIAGTNTSFYGVDVRANSGFPVSNILIFNNTIHDHGPSYDVDQDSHMVTVASYVSSVWILQNNLYNSSGSGMQIGAGAPGPTFVYIGKNTVNNSRQAGIWVKYGTDVIVSENTVHDIQDRCVGTDTSPSKGLGGQYAPNYVWWINNEVYNARYGIRVPSTNAGQGQYYAIGNKIHHIKDMGGACFNYPTGNNTWDMAAIHFHGGHTKYAINNTIDSVTSGIHDSDTVTGAYFFNNIVSNVNHPNGYGLFTETESKTTTDYNIYYNPAGKLIKWGTGVAYPNLATFQAAVPTKEQNSSESNPLYVNQIGNDYALQSSSIAINMGMVSAVYQTFSNRYGINIQRDIIGTARPQGSAWDIGAYEYVSGGDTTPPAAPTGLSVS